MGHKVHRNTDLLPMPLWVMPTMDLLSILPMHNLQMPLTTTINTDHL